MRLWQFLATCVLPLLGSTDMVRGDEFMSRNVKVHYILRGKGEPVILIHGLASSTRLNWELPGVIAELEKHYRVIAFDNRGHGLSDKPQAEGQYGVEMVEDVVGLMDQLHISKAHVVGYSLGGMIALKLAVLHPERVSSMVLGGMGWLQADKPVAHFWEAMKGRAIPAVPPACLHGIAALGVTEAEVKAVRVPVTILIGERDLCRRLYVEPLEKVRPDWPVHLIKDAGHMNCVVQTEFKTQLVEALRKPGH